MMTIRGLIQENSPLPHCIFLSRLIYLIEIRQCEQEHEEERKQQKLLFLGNILLNLE
jgi:hypothetical protein